MCRTRSGSSGPTARRSAARRRPLVRRGRGRPHPRRYRAQPVQAALGALRAQRRGGHHRRGDRQERAPGGRPEDRRLDPRSVAAVHDRGDRDVRLRRVARRRNGRDLRPAPGAGADRQAGQARLHPRSRAGRRGSGRTASRHRCRAATWTAGREREEPGSLRPRWAQAGARHRAEVPPSLRHHRAVRRRLRDLQHAGDHGRPAQPGVRPAAHDRRLTPSGAGLRGGRGGRDRPGRVGDRDRRRPRADRGSECRLQGAQHGTARERHGAREPDRVGVAAVRRRRDDNRWSHAGRPRHAGRAGCGAPRGRHPDVTWLTAYANRGGGALSGRRRRARLRHVRGRRRASRVGWRRSALAR